MCLQGQFTVRFIPQWMAFPRRDHSRLSYPYQVGGIDIQQMTEGIFFLHQTAFFYCACLRRIRTTKASISSLLVGSLPLFLTKRGKRA